MKINDINLNGGKMIFWNLDLIDISKEFSEQVWEFKEDLALIEFPNNISLSLGWYPSFKENGQFSLIIFADSDFVKQIEKYNFNKLDILKETLNRYCKKCYDLSR